MTALARQQIVTFAGAFDKRHPDPARDYGIHGVELRMVLKGPEGAVHFVLFTNWQLPAVRREFDERTLRKAARAALDQMDLNVSYHPQPAELGYHSRRPLYEGQALHRPTRLDKTGPGPFDLRTVNTTEDVPGCPYLDGAPCYCDSSSFAAADDMYEVLLREGSDGVWRELHRYYDETFFAPDAPDTEMPSAEEPRG